MKKVLDKPLLIVYNKDIKEREERTMNEQKMEILRGMVENGYHLMGWTMEEMCEVFTLEDLQNFAKKFAENK